MLLFLLCCGAAASCGGVNTCNGCQPQPIPGGFPAKEIYFNASQLRITDSAVSFLERNFEALLRASLNDDLSFTFNESSSGSYRACHNADCRGTIDLVSSKIYLLPGSTIALSIRAMVTTNTIPFEIDVPLVGWEKCNATYDTGRSGQPDLWGTVNIELVIDHNDRRKLVIRRGESILQGFERDDIRISGGVVCDIAEWLLYYFEDELRDNLAEVIFTQIDHTLRALPAGQEGRVAVGALHPEPSPAAESSMDAFLWAGGFALTEGGGLSLGAMAGFRATQHNECVARREPPVPRTLAPSLLLKGNLRPDGKGFHVGVSLHRQVLESALYAFYDSGGLCVDLTKQTVSQLSSGFFALLAPSLAQLTGGKETPMRLSLRPRYPFGVIYGRGTSHLDAEGNVVIDDPLIRLIGREVAVDLTIELEGRPVRLLSLVSDLDIPMLLEPTADGALQPVTGSLSGALFDPKIEGSMLLGESPEALAAIFPTLIGMATSSLADVFSAIALPEVAGLQPVLDDGSIVALDQDILAVFVDFALAQNTSYDDPFYVDASIEPLEPASRAAGLRGRRVTARTTPAARLTLSARLPRRWQGESARLEYSYRVDGGFFRPWSPARQVVVRDPLLWLPGPHRVEVRARLRGIRGAFAPTQVLTLQIANASTRAPARPQLATSSATLDETSGCALGGQPAAAAPLLLLIVLSLRRRRGARRSPRRR